MSKTKNISKYATVSTARAQRASNYVQPGHYLALVNSIEEGTSFKKGEFIAAQFTILKTFENSISGFDYNRKVAVPLHVAGEQVTDIVMVTNIAFESRIKAMAMTIGDLTEADFGKEKYPGEIIEEMVSDENPLAGMVVEFKSETIIKREAKAKPEEALVNTDVYTRIAYLRRVLFSELPDLVDESTLNRFVPDLAKEIADESGE